MVVYTVDRNLSSMVLHNSININTEKLDHYAIKFVGDVLEYYATSEYV